MLYSLAGGRFQTDQKQSPAEHQQRYNNQKTNDCLCLLCPLTDVVTYLLQATPEALWVGSIRIVSGRLNPCGRELGPGSRTAPGQCADGFIGQHQPPCTDSHRGCEGQVLSVRTVATTTAPPQQLTGHSSSPPQQPVQAAHTENDSAGAAVIVTAKLINVLTIQTAFRSLQTWDWCGWVSWYVQFSLFMTK